jgi:hypothetical protein
MVKGNELKCHPFNEGSKKFNPIVQEEMIKILNFNNDDGRRNNGNRTPIDSNYLSLWRSELKIYN